MSNFVDRLGEFPRAGQKAPVVTATTGPITLSGAQTIDTVLVNTSDRVLVKDQANAAENGIYAVNGQGPWKRSTDCNNQLDLVDGTKVLNSNDGVEYFVSFTGDNWIVDVTETTWTDTTSSIVVNWGDINGTLSAQTDLQTALDGKVNNAQVLTDVPLGAVFTDTDTNDAAIWGNITGTLSSQTDLQNALNLLAPLANPNFTGKVKIVELEETEGTVNGTATTPEIDCDTGTVFSHTVSTGPTTLSTTGESTVAAFTLYLTNGGSQTFTYPTGTRFAGGSEPALTAAGLDILTFTTRNGGTNWDVGALLDVKVPA